MENAGQMFSGAKDSTLSTKAIPSLAAEKIFHVGQMRTGAVDCTKSLKNANELLDSRFGQMKTGATEIKVEELPVEQAEENNEPVLDGSVVGDHLWEIPTVDWTIKTIKEVLGVYGVIEYPSNARKQTLIDMLNAAKEQQGILDLSNKI